MKSRLVVLVVSVVVLGGLLVGGVWAFGPATTRDAKPAGDLVSNGATALYWQYSMPLPGGVRYGVMRVTSPRVISEVREMIDALPVATSSYLKTQACPADAMVPYIVSFSRSSLAKSFTKVVFQLGGCPSATVYQHGEAVTPTLGDWGLAKQYAKIQKVISPRGQPLA